MLFQTHDNTCKTLLSYELSRIGHARSHRYQKRLRRVGSFLDRIGDTEDSLDRIGEALLGDTQIDICTSHGLNHQLHLHEFFMFKTTSKYQLNIP